MCIAKKLAKKGRQTKNLTQQTKQHVQHIFTGEGHWMPTIDS